MKKWTSEEDGIVRREMEDGDKSWDQLAEMLPGRTTEAIKHRGAILGIQSPSAHEKWTAEEEAALRRAVSEGATTWAEVADALNRGDSTRSRSSLACKHHATQLGLGLQ